MRRNLYYNCCPIEASGAEWRDNVRMLSRYRSIFNGRRIVVIRTGDGMEDSALVHEAFLLNGFDDAQYVTRPNDPELHETAGFIDTLALLESLDPNEATFYAHTKGVRLSEPKEVRRVSIMQWRNRMYHECLHDAGRIDAVLSNYATAGCFFLPKHPDQKKDWIRWMFAGTFFWFNHARLFSKDWRYLGPYADRFSTENYLGIHFEREDAYTLYGREVRENLYGAAVSCFRCHRCGKLSYGLLKRRDSLRCCPTPLQPLELLFHPELVGYPPPKRLVV